MHHSLISSLLLAVSAAISMGIAWLVPGTFPSALLGWCSVISLTLLIRSKAPYRILWLCGLLTHAIGFYWLTGTISFFGGFPLTGALLVTLLFCVVGGMQYVLAGLVSRALPGIFKSSGLAVAIGWTTSEFAWLRIFPWMVGHTQIAWTEFVQIADTGGVPLITFAMFYLAENLIITLKEKRLILPSLRLAAVLALILYYGSLRIEQIQDEISAAPAIKVALPQANVSIEERHNQRFFGKNTERYYALSKKAILEESNPLLIVWPEAVGFDALPTTLKNVNQYPGLEVPYFGEKSGILFGSLTYTPVEDTTPDKALFHNSAVAINSDGSVAGFYHKQILMPFGEYMPFATVFPLLQRLNPMAAGAFTAGKDVEVFPVKLADNTIKLSPLICYEDVMPSLSRLATKKGATVLASLSNDGWFRETMAPLQHHLIASFRAIENRRYFIRSTNTGYTAIVNPLGETEIALPPFSEDLLVHEIHPLQNNSTFVSGIFFWFPHLIGFTGLFLLLFALLRERLTAAELAIPAAP